MVQKISNSLSIELVVQHCSSQFLLPPSHLQKKYSNNHRALEQSINHVEMEGLMGNMVHMGEVKRSQNVLKQLVPGPNSYRPNTPIGRENFFHEIKMGWWVWAFKGLGETQSVLDKMGLPRPDPSLTWFMNAPWNAVINKDMFRSPRTTIFFAALAANGCELGF